MPSWKVDQMIKSNKIKWSNDDDDPHQVEKLMWRDKAFSSWTAPLQSPVWRSRECSQYHPCHHSEIVAKIQICSDTNIHYIGIVFYTYIFRYLFELLFKHIYFVTSWSQCPSSSFLDFSLPDLIWKRSVSSQHNKEKLCSVDEWVPCYELLCQLLDLGSPVRLSCQKWVNRVTYFLYRSDIASNGWVKEKTLPEAQRTQGIESITWVISPAK